MAKQVIVLLHGVGSNGKDMALLGQSWSEVLPDAVFISPNAPFPFTHNSTGYQWFSIEGVTPENRASRIIAARKDFHDTIEKQLIAHDVDPVKDNVILVGFSQGSIMSLDYLINGSIPLAGIVAFSGRLATTSSDFKHPETPVLLVHGKSDPMIPYTESKIAAKTLREIGYQVSESYEPDTIHTISATGSKVAAEFIADILK